MIVVDEDIDVSNLEELIWAMLTRSDPASSIDIIHNAWSTPLDPRIEPERKAVGDNTNSRAIIDACRPWHWRENFPRVNVPTPEERRLAQENSATCSRPDLGAPLLEQFGTEEARRELAHERERLLRCEICKTQLRISWTNALEHCAGVRIGGRGDGRVNQHLGAEPLPEHGARRTEFGRLASMAWL